MSADPNIAAPHASQAPTSALIDSVLHHGQALLRTEVDLAKQEVGRAASRLTRAGILIGCAVLFALVAFHALAVAGVLGLMALGLPGWLAATITTGVVIALAIGCGLAGKAQLSAKKLSPNRTFSHLKTDYSALKETFRAG